MGRFSTLFRRKNSYADIPEVGSEEGGLIFTNFDQTSDKFGLFDGWNDLEAEEEPQLPYYEAYDDSYQTSAIDMSTSVKEKAKRRVQQISQMTQKYLKKNKGNQQSADAHRFHFGGRLRGADSVHGGSMNNTSGILNKAIRTIKRPDPMDQINQVIENVLEKGTANTVEVRQHQRMDLEVLASPTGELTAWSSVSVPSRKSDESASGGTLDENKGDQNIQDAPRLGPGHLIAQTPKSSKQLPWMNTTKEDEPETEVPQRKALRENRLVKIGNALAKKISKKKKVALQKQKLEEESLRLSEMLEKCDSGSSKPDNSSEDVLSELIEEADNEDQENCHKSTKPERTISVATQNVALSSRTSEKFNRQNTLSPVEEELPSDAASNLETLEILVLSESDGIEKETADNIDKHASLLLDILEHGNTQELIVFDDEFSNTALLKAQGESDSDSNMSPSSLNEVMDIAKVSISAHNNEASNTDEANEDLSEAKINVDDFVQSTPYSLKPSEAVSSPGSRFSFNFPESASKGPISSPLLHRTGHPAEIASPENCFSDGSLSLNSIEFEKIEGIDSLEDSQISSLHTVSTASLPSARNSVSLTGTNSILLQDEPAVWNNAGDVMKPQVSSTQKDQSNQNSDMESMWNSISQAVSSSVRVVKDLRPDFGFVLCQSQHCQQNEMEPKDLKRQGISIQAFRQNLAECVDDNEIRENASRFSFEDEKASKMRDSLKSMSSDSSHGSQSIKVSFLRRHLPTECAVNYSGDRSFDEGEERKHPLWIDGCKPALSAESSHSFESEKEEEHNDDATLEEGRTSGDKGSKLTIATSHADNTSEASDALAGAADEFVRGIINSPMANSQKSDPRMSSVTSTPSAKSKKKFSLKMLSPRRVLAAMSPKSGKSGSHGPENTTSKKSISFHFGNVSPSPKKQFNTFEYGVDTVASESPSKLSRKSVSSPRLGFFGKRKVTPTIPESLATGLDRPDDSLPSGSKSRLPLSPRFVFGGSKVYEESSRSMKQRSRSCGHNNKSETGQSLRTSVTNERSRSASSLEARAQMIKHALSPRLSLRNRQGSTGSKAKSVTSVVEGMEEEIKAVPLPVPTSAKVDVDSYENKATEREDKSSYLRSSGKREIGKAECNAAQAEKKATKVHSRSTIDAKASGTFTRSHGGLSQRTVEMMQKHKNINLALLGLNLTASSATEESTINESVNSMDSSDDESFGEKDQIKLRTNDSVQAVMQTSRLTGYSIPLKSRYPSYASRESIGAPSVRKSLGTRRDDTFLMDASIQEEDGREELLDDAESLCYSATE